MVKLARAQKSEGPQCQSFEGKVGSKELGNME